MFFEAMHPRWQALLADQKVALESIKAALAEEPEAYLPAPQNVMRAFETDPADVRVLIVGQDPYPTPGHAVGLAFACPLDQRPQPRSLQNIRAELASDLGISLAHAATIDLTEWQSQGVMLLNRTLTVAPGDTHSHQQRGWPTFTATAIARLAGFRGEQLVVMLWGKPAQAVAPLIATAVSPDNILVSAHPSPLSARRGFFGSRPFSRANVLLEKTGQRKIDWIG